MTTDVIEIRVLGAVGVFREGTEIELGPQLRRVLAVLVAREGSVVSVDRLIDAVWMGEPPDGADGSIKTYITRLRRAIDPDRAGLIEYHKPGYVLALPEHAVDGARFEGEVDEAVRMLRIADDEAAIAALTVALARWCGDAYAGFADEDWARPEAVRLEERRLEASELLIEAQLDAGNTERALANARSLVEAELLRERPRELLMRALHAAGRQADALREFARFREYLVEEAGLNPSEHLIEVERRISQADGLPSGRVRTLRGYELGEKLGQGAFSVVHRAVQPGIERDVAVKIIRSELADRPDFVRRFEQEARVVAALEHPHIVPLYDFWREPGAAYLVMRWLRGGSVEDALRSRGPFALEAAADLLREIGSALEAAHRKGVVHRDVRPANLLLDEQGIAYLADFGIALPVEASDELAIAAPAYASPEILLAEPASTTADVLSLGITAFEILTGRLPFADSDSRAELIRRQLSEPLPSARATRADIPSGVDGVLARATAKAPADRHATVSAFVDELVGALAANRGAAPASSPRTPSVPVADEMVNPYLGLQAFDEADADRFHGREALVVELVEALEREPFVVAVGPSGSGKSSVVRAGLLPAVRRGAVAGSDEWFITTMLPGADPIAALETALLRIAVNPPVSLREQLREPGGLLRAVRRVLPGDDSRILIVVDQFEELFTMTGEVESGRFLSELASAISAPGSPLRVVATLRADHYDVPLRHPAFAQLTTDGTVTVRPLSPAELERVIVRPAAAVGIDVEPGLTAELVAGVSDRPALLPLLQFALTESFERRLSNVMMASVHHELGGLTGALATRADRIVAAGAGSDEDEIRRIFGRLVTLGDGGEDTRRRARRAELGREEATSRILDAFVSARLLTTDRDDQTREPTIEVAHEALLRDWPRLRAWLAEDREDLRLLRGIGSAAVAWAASGRDAGELARGGRLENASVLLMTRPALFNDAEVEWTEASIERAQAEAEAEAEASRRDRRQNRQLRQLLALALSLVVLAVVAASVAVVVRNRAVDSEAAAITAGQAADQARDQALANEQQARDSETEARSAEEFANTERIAALSSVVLTSDPELAILLALEANRRRDDVTTQTAVHRSIAAQPTLTGLIPSPLDESSRVGFSKDGSVGVAWTRSLSSGAVQLFDPASGEVMGERFTTDVGVLEAVLSGDGEAVAVALNDGSIRVIDRSGQGLGPTQILTEALLGLDLDYSGSRLLVSGEDSTEIVDVASGVVVSAYFADEDSEIGIETEFGVALSDDGSFFVTAFRGEVPASEPGVVYRNTGLPEKSGYDIVAADTGQRIERVEGPPASSLSLSSQDVLAVGYTDGTIEVRDLVGDDPAAFLDGPDESVTAVAVAVDGTVVSAVASGQVNVWSAGDYFEASSVRLDGRPFRAGFRPDGTAIVSFEGAGVAVIDASASNIVDAREETLQAVSMVPAHPYYGRLSEDGVTAEMVRLADGSAVFKVRVEALWPHGYGSDGFFASDGRWMLTWQATGNEFVVSNVREADRRYLIDVGAAYQDATGLPWPEDSSTAARPAPGGERVIVLTRDLLGGPGVGFWIDSATGELIGEAIEADGLGLPMVMDDGAVVSGSHDASVRILPPDLVGPIVDIPGTEGFRPLDKDEEAGLVLIGSSGGKVGLVDVETATVRFLQDASGVLNAGAFSPDGARLVVFSLADGAQVIDVATGLRVGDPMMLDGAVALDYAVAWSEDGQGVWIGTEDGPARFAADGASWREIACGVVNRELTAEEWRTLVSPTDPQVPSCP